MDAEEDFIVTEQGVSVCAAHRKEVCDSCCLHFAALNKMGATAVSSPTNRCLNQNEDGDDEKHNLVDPSLYSPWSGPLQPQFRVGPPNATFGGPGDVQRDLLETFYVIAKMMDKSQCRRVMLQDEGGSLGVCLDILSVVSVDERPLLVVRFCVNRVGDPKFNDRLGLMLKHRIGTLMQPINTTRAELDIVISLLKFNSGQLARSYVESCKAELPASCFKLSFVRPLRPLVPRPASQKVHRWDLSPSSYTF